MAIFQDRRQGGTDDDWETRDCRLLLASRQGVDAIDAELGTDGTAYLRKYHEQYLNDRIRQVKVRRGFPLQDPAFVLPWLRPGWQPTRPE